MIETVIEKLREFIKKIFNSKPITSALVLLIIPIITGIIVNFVSVWWADRNDISANQEINNRYNEDFSKELEKNLRILQYYVWLSKKQWKGALELKYDVKLYTSFVQSQKAPIRNLIDTGLLSSDIVNTYNNFERANEIIIKEINSETKPTTHRKQVIIQFFSSLINEAIQVHRKICESINQEIDPNKTYLTAKWSESEVLEKNFHDFIKVENIAVASGSYDKYIIIDNQPERPLYQATAESEKF